MLTPREHCELQRAEAELAARVGALAELLEHDRGMWTPELVEAASELPHLRRQLERVSARLDAEGYSAEDHSRRSQFLGRWLDG